MNYAEESEQAGDFFNKCHDILKRKANDYASSNDVFSNFRKIAYMCNVSIEQTFLMFMAVKLARLEELRTKESKTGESTIDSLRDIANYACLMSIYVEAMENIK